MAKTYDKAPTEIVDRAQRLIDKHYPQFNREELKIDYLIAMADEGKPAIMHQGHQALGLCRIVNLKDRAKGNGDVEILIDKAHYDEMSAKKRDGLIHHELHHILLVEDDDDPTAIKRDDLNRPKVKMRKHTIDVGWFAEIAEIYGADSVEVSQAQIMWNEHGQAFFPMLTEA